MRSPFPPVFKSIHLTGPTAFTVSLNGWRHIICKPWRPDNRGTCRCPLHLLSSPAAIEENDEGKPEIFLDFDKNGNIVGMEILEAWERMENPRGVSIPSPSRSDRS